MKRILYALILLSCALVVYAQKTATFPQLVDPRYLIVDNDQVIISDYPHIYLFSLEDFALKKKIGGPGEGPGEFDIPKQNMNLKERGLVVSVCPDTISVSSVGRISFFDRNGNFKELKKMLPYNLNAKYIYLCERFLIFSPKSGKLIVSLFDSKLNKLVDINKSDYWLRFGGGKDNFFDRPSDTLLVAVHDSKIFMTRGDSQIFAIDAFDFNGNKLFTINRDTEKVKITKSFIERIHKHFRFKFRNKKSEYFIKNLYVPEYFPPLRNIYAADQKLYVVTFNVIAGKTEILVYSTEGKYLEKLLLPVKERNPEQLFPFSFSRNTFYQIVENEETETWELFVTPIN